MSRTTIVLTGGGSGGHILPVLAVAAALKHERSDLYLVYIGQKGDGLADLPANDPNIDEVHFVRAGKFRRYHGEGFKQLLDVKTVGLNLRDLVYIVIGIVQSYFLIGRLRPRIIFTRGGHVSVPVALGGRLRGVPYITHDSDSTPSLANRLIARWARLHAVALPAELYPYPSNKTVMVGVPVGEQYKLITSKLQAHAKRELGLTAAKQVVLVTGGGNGARQLNRVVISNAVYLLERYSQLYLVHVAGRTLEQEVAGAYDRELSKPARARVIVKGFVSNLYDYSAAADLIVARGGATNLAEFAVQGKACVIVPSKQLIWNVKNTDVLAGRGAVVKLTEDQAEQERRLAYTLAELLDNDIARHQLATELAKLGRPDAAHRLAVLLLEQLPAA